MTHFIEVQVNTVGGKMWDNKVIIWCLPKYSKQEFEVLSADENDIITARKHFRSSGFGKSLDCFPTHHSSVTCFSASSLSIGAFQMPCETCVVLT